MSRLDSWLHAYKPAASRRSHLLAASLMWSIVGTVLFLVGVAWILPTKGWPAVLMIVAAATGGFLKCRFILSRTARRAIDRINQRGDGRCLGGFVSWRSWGLVAVMAIGGRMLRLSPLPRAYLGMLYAAIGAALLVGAVIFWRAWSGAKARP